MAPTMNTSSLDYRQCFRIDPNTPVDALLKRGIFRTFELLQKRYPSKAHQIRLAVVNALNILSQVDANIQGQHIRTNTEKPAFGVTFFSSIHDRLIEFVPSKDVGKFKAQGHSIDKLPAANSKSSKGQQANVAFKSVLLKVLDLCPIDSVERVLFEGVFFILQMSEDFAGPVIQVSLRVQRLCQSIVAPRLRPTVSNPCIGIPPAATFVRQATRSL